MPADASIYNLMQQPKAAPGPLDQFAQAQTVRNLMQSGQLQDAQIRTAERTLADDESTAAAYREAAGDPKRLKELLYGRGLYKQATAAEKAALEAQKEKGLIQKNEVDVRGAQVKQLRDITAGIQDDVGLRLLRDETTKIFGPEVAAQIPQTTADPSFRAWQEKAVLDSDKFIAQQNALRSDATSRRGQDMSAATAAEGRAQSAREGAAGRAVTIRGQDLTDTRAREAAAAAAAKEKSPSDAENVAAGYAARMRNSALLLSDLEKTGGKPELTETALSAVGSKMGANISMSPDRQKYRQAQEDWVRAKLRKESGAVIADDEMEREIRVYFPQIGDDPGTVAQKADSRKQAEISMAQAAGKAKIPDPVTPGGQSASGRIGQPTRAQIDAELKRRGIIK